MFSFWTKGPFAHAWFLPSHDRGIRSGQNGCDYQFPGYCLRADGNPHDSFEYAVGSPGERGSEEVFCGIEEEHLAHLSIYHREGWEPVAIHWSRVNEPPLYCHREPLAGVAIHCEPVSEETNAFTFTETRWIAASDCRPPRNDKVIYLEGGAVSSIWAPASGSITRRAKRWTWSRSSVLREAYSNLPRRSV